MFCQACGSELLLDGRYRVIRLISDKGGFGKTYEVRYSGTAKVLKVLINNSAKAVELFEREARVLQQLSHPGIPRGEEYFIFHAKNSQTPLHCLVMEYIRGTDLEEYQEQREYRPISQRLALDWLLQLAEIIDAVHGQQLVHRDIKPSNIILNRDGQLFLIDFGAVREISPAIMAQGTTTQISTSGYAAPEQEKGRAVPQSDFFALGATFVYLLTGFNPSDPAIYNSGQDTLDWRPHSSDLSPELAEFIDSLMEHKADDRPRNTEEVRQTLAQIKLALYPQPRQPRAAPPPLLPAIAAQSVPPTAASPPPAVPSGKPTSGLRRFITVATFTAIAAVAGALGWENFRDIALREDVRTFLEGCINAVLEVIKLIYSRLHPFFNIYQ